MSAFQPSFDNKNYYYYYLLQLLLLLLLLLLLPLAIHWFGILKQLFTTVSVMNLAVDIYRAYPPLFKLGPVCWPELMAKAKYFTETRFNKISDRHSKPNLDHNLHLLPQNIQHHLEINLMSFLLLTL